MEREKEGRITLLVLRSRRSGLVRPPREGRMGARSRTGSRTGESSSTGAARSEKDLTVFERGRAGRPWLGGC